MSFAEMQLTGLGDSINPSRLSGACRDHAPPPPPNALNALLALMAGKIEFLVGSPTPIQLFPVPVTASAFVLIQ